MNDEIHMFTFMHTIKCKYGGKCNNNDFAHLTDYDHPDFCKDQSHCHDIRPEHLFDYRHLPVCRNGIDCPKYLKHDDDHIKSFRHCRSICPNDNFCNYFHEKIHMKNTIHSFRPPCPFTYVTFFGHLFILGDMTCTYCASYYHPSFSLIKLNGKSAESSFAYDRSKSKADSRNLFRIKLIQKIHRNKHRQIFLIICTFFFLVKYIFH
jgi:hypothetical protein